MTPPKPVPHFHPHTQAQGTSSAQPKNIDPKVMESEVLDLILLTPRFVGDPYPSHELRVCEKFVRRHPSYEHNRTTVYACYVKVFSELRNAGKLPPISAATPSGPTPAPRNSGPTPRNSGPIGPDGKRAAPSPAHPSTPGKAKPAQATGPASTPKASASKPQAAQPKTPKAPTKSKPPEVIKKFEPLPPKYLEILREIGPDKNGESIQVMKRPTQVLDSATLERMKKLIGKEIKDSSKAPPQQQ